MKCLEDCDDGLPKIGGIVFESAAKIIIICLSSLIFCVLVCFGVACYRKRKMRKEETEKIMRRASMGKKGYDIVDEKEDDSDGSEDESIEYGAPAMN